MKTINLKKYYPYDTDTFIQVTDEVAAYLEECRKADKAQFARISYYRAYYSLDIGDMIERNAVVLVETPEELYMRAAYNKELYGALRKLPEKQKRRIYIHFICEIPETEIAQEEGVNVSAVSQTIKKGMKKLQEILKKG